MLYRCFSGRITCHNQHDQVISSLDCSSINDRTHLLSGSLTLTQWLENAVGTNGFHLSHCEHRHVCLAKEIRKLVTITFKIWPTLRRLANDVTTLHWELQPITSGILTSKSPRVFHVHGYWLTSCSSCYLYTFQLLMVSKGDTMTV